ncbi:glycerol-3-phosphate 1-O-acyltransferase PlsY [Legionella lytica]|uniref:Glycerol-3-phosphate acyltransferase n=1 Tax=Legionella lytica TaxID=96232 RepID=A0ABY4YA95_9GAMM|nr:glycerol-3-phosphate 1-O-acyltransferase PlsY [Legionella lytica]USQ14546.1 glycerol-3-phosphate 1-O-acyltransferase PlsY [Legionella lytica]
MILAAFLIILAYLMGSICSAVIVCKTFALPDPRTEGSQNPGATNVLRLAGKKYAIIVLVTDLLKGTIPVLIAKMFGADATLISYVALAAVIGHMYPFFFGFKGGKGVATAIGALLGFQFIVGMMVTATWLLVVRLSRFSSLASIVSIGLAPFYSILIIGRINIFPPIFFMAVLILIKHKDNILRLIDGTESKVKFKQKSVMEEVMDDPPPPANSADITADEHLKTAEVIELSSARKTAVNRATDTPVEEQEKTAKKTAAKEDNAEKKPATPKAKKPKDDEPKDNL